MDAGDVRLEGLVSDLTLRRPKDAPHGDAGGRSGEGPGKHRPPADARPVKPSKVHRGYE